MSNRISAQNVLSAQFVRKNRNQLRHSRPRFCICCLVYGCFKLQESPVLATHHFSHRNRHHRMLLLMLLFPPKLLPSPSTEATSCTQQHDEPNDTSITRVYISHITCNKLHVFPGQSCNRGRIGRDVEQQRVQAKCRCFASAQLRHVRGLAVHDKHTRVAYVKRSSSMITSFICQTPFLAESTIVCCQVCGNTY